MMIPFPKRRVLVLVAAALLVAAAVTLVLFLRPGAGTEEAPRARVPDPRREYAGPFRNVSPDVHYVPDNRCAECHEAIAASYARHPMGRSFFATARAPAPPAGERQNNPFRAFGERFLVEYQGSRAHHVRTRLDPAGRPAAEQKCEVDYVIGSGTRGYSYLTDHDGYLFQTPISWYSQKNKGWDLSPGFTPGLLTGRAILPECLFCHANRANHVDGSENRYAKPVFDGHAIGCQRCHGPGELHVAAPGAGKGADGIDPTIVNPKHLTADLSRSVCEQCHLQGVVRIPRRGRGLYDFRPGLPLESCWAVFVRAPGSGEGAQAVGQVEQMYESRCFQGGRAGSGGKQLGCVSCHDPHAQVPPERRVAHYRARCLSCHQEQGCKLPLPDRLQRTAADSCIDCHMPRYGASDIPHTAATDHRIPRGGKSAARGGAPQDPGDGWPVVSFYRGRKGVDEAEDERCRAVGLIKMTLGGESSAVKAIGNAVPALEIALRHDPDDLPAGEARGYALALQDQWVESLASFRAVLARAPERESALVGAATAAETLGQAEAALGYWRRAVATNPWAVGYRRSLTLLLVKREAWGPARSESEAWVRLDPLSAEARAARVTCLLRLGDKAEARAEFARIVELAPANLRELQIRFERKLR
jgi:hypothetical protein